MQWDRGNLRRSIVMLLVTLLAVLVGCSRIDQPSGPEVPDSSTTTPPASELPPVTLPLINMTVGLADASDIVVHHYDLGDAGIVNSIGRPVPSPLTGIIAVPTEPGPHPLVVFLHGVTAVDAITDPVYAGFDYAVQQMAAQGFVALSLNLNVNYSINFGESGSDEWAYELFNQTLTALEIANAGGHPVVEAASSVAEPNSVVEPVETTTQTTTEPTTASPNLGIDLTNQIDFTNIHLVGHSRGGEVADHIYRFDAEAGISRIKSIVRVAATVVPHYGQHPDIPHGFILPELDGDVDNLAQLVFDEILADAPSRNAFANAVFLTGANHNFFNREFTFDDRFGDRSFANPADQSTWLTRQQQEDFLVRYLTAFYAAVRNGAEDTHASPVQDLNTSDAAFDPRQPQPATMFGYPVVASTVFPGMRPLLPQPNQASVAQVSTQGSAQVGFYVQTFPAAAVGPGLFNHPAVLTRPDQRLPLYEITWGVGTGDAAVIPGVTFPIAGGAKSSASALSLFIAVDATNTDLNAPGLDQAMTVGLEDAHGNQVSVEIPAGTPALRNHPGELVERESFVGTMELWEGFTPLGELRIPMQEFVWAQIQTSTPEFDLENISNITLRFTPNTTGSLMLQNAYLVSQ